MRCLSCNAQLTDKEATRKYANSGKFIDLCDGCFKHVSGEIDSVEGNNYKDDDGDSIEYDTGDDGED